jgi:hypothetical protein
MNRNHWCNRRLHTTSATSFVSGLRRCWVVRRGSLPQGGSVGSFRWLRAFGNLLATGRLSNFSHRGCLLRKLLPVRLRLIGGVAGVLIGVTLRVDRDALQKSSEPGPCVMLRR